MKKREPILVLVMVALMLAPALGQQPTAPPTFSIDMLSPTLGVIPGGDGGDILACVPPAPSIPTPPAVLPAPGILIQSGLVPGGLGLVPAAGGWLEVDALSYGNDVYPFGAGTWYFSVDRAASGIALVPGPSVTTEGARIGAAQEASADVFQSSVSTANGPVGPPVNPPAPYGNNTGYFDGNGLLSAPPSMAVYTGLGLNFEPNPPAGQGFGDNLDALDMDTVPGPQTPVFYSLDAVTAAANQVLSADVLVSIPGGNPQRYAEGYQLGLNGAWDPLKLDNVDAMILWENGIPGFQPGVDILLYSVDAASPAVGQNDSMFGRPIEPGDILMDPVWSRALGGVGGATPGIFIAAEELGLDTGRSFAGASDELDALDVVPEPATGILLLALVLTGLLARVWRRR